MSAPLLPTPSQTVGPYFSLGLCVRPAADLVPPDSPRALRLGGRVLDGAGNPVPDALVEIWQRGSGWGRCGTQPDGGYAFTIVRPARVPDGLGGLQAPHVDALVFARGLLKPVRTRVYFADEAAANGEDALLNALSEDERATLLAVPAGGGFRFDVRLQGERQTTFFALDDQLADDRPEAR